VSVLGRLLRNRRAGDTHLAWRLPQLSGPETLTLTSADFEDGATMPLPTCAKRIGGADRSPQLSWSELPPGTAALLLVVEDIDVPVPKPIVHCVALIEPSVEGLDQGALDATTPAAGVRPVRATLGRGYHGPAPISGHGPHRYVFQLFALARPLDGDPDRAKPRDLLGAVTAPVLARGRITGVYERPVPPV